LLRALFKTIDERAPEDINYTPLARSLLAQVASDPREQHIPACASIRDFVDWLFCASGLHLQHSRNDYLVALCHAFVSDATSSSILKFLESGDPIPFPKADRLKITLVVAAASNDCQLIKQLLLTQVGTKDTSSPWAEALPAASERGNLEAVQLLLEDAELLDRWDSVTPALILAAWKGHEDLVYLLTKPPYLSHHLPQGIENASILASNQGHVIIVKHLIKLQSLGGIDGVKWEIFIRGLVHGRVQIVRLAVCEWSFTITSRVLDMAAEFGHSHVINFLLAHGARVQYKGGKRSALALTASNGHEEAAKILVDAGASVDCRMDGDCPFIVAAKNSQVSFLRFLVKHGADLNHRNCAGEICAEIALEAAAGNGRQAVIFFLVNELGIRPNGDPMNKRDINPLLAAMMYGQPQAVSTLHELGFDPIDPRRTYCAAHFECGAYPMGPWPLRCVKRISDRASGATIQIWAHRE